MIKYNEMNIFNCEYKNTIIEQLSDKYKINIKDTGINASILMKEIYFNSLIDRNQKQYIYYIIRTRHKRDYKNDKYNLFEMPALGWDWHRCGIHIYDCNNIIESDYITKSHHIKFSRYVNRCSDCDHLLFCNNLSNKSYMAFNQPVEPKRFRELKAMSLTELKKQPEFNKSLYKMLRSIHKILKKGESHNEIHNG